jgi:hypothetical protein
MTPRWGRIRPARHWIATRHRTGIELQWSVTGEAEAGSAGEQPADGWRLTDLEPIGTGRLPATRASFYPLAREGRCFPVALPAGAPRSAILVGEFLEPQTVWDVRFDAGTGDRCSFSGDRAGGRLQPPGGPRSLAGRDASPSFIAICPKRRTRTRVASPPIPSSTKRTVLAPVAQAERLVSASVPINT